MRRSRRPLAAVLAVAAVALAACGDDPEAVADPTAGIEGVEVEDGQSNGHLDEGWSYDADPPSGGDHAPIWLNCDVYDIEVPNHFAVHSLEHGVVWFAHDPDLSAEELEPLLDVAGERPDRTIVSPYEGLDAPVVAVAWERRLEADGPDDPRLADFLDAFVNGAQAPEPAAVCEGGVGLNP